MYTTCIYCHKPLGRNEAIEPFPVGRRLAFDAALGRLWVVCRTCERWNLSPIETRWEAIEECERAFSATRLRVSTENIGLARLPEGLELVRVGAPQRPEFAAWRYGDQFGRRRRRAYLIGGGVAAALGAVVVVGAAAGVGVGSFGGIWGNLPNMINAARKVKLRTDDGRILTVRGTAFPKVQFAGDPETGRPSLSFALKGKPQIFQGEEAVRLAGQLLPAINSSGGGAKAVQQAVRALEIREGPERYLETFFASAQPLGRKGQPKPFASLSAPNRLALEMALHEEAERRAIQGELALLEAAWREAEEIAGIADKLLVPAEVDAQLAALKGRGGSAAGVPD
jgi:hypothetical protein